MGEIVNLRRARKTKARADKQRVAAINRVIFGRTGAQKAAAQAEAERQTGVLDGAKRE